MKPLTLITVALFVLNITQLKAQLSDAETMKTFLKEIPALANEKASSYQTIQGFNTIAGQKAVKTVTLTGENMKTALTDAKQYKHCIITVGVHTIVKVTDFKNCSQSGSWGACMPYGKGYIRKGGFTEKNDYINNIIGRPDSQVRTMFLFN